MAAKTVKIGSIVKLKSGGPDMTVAGVVSGMATATWFHEGTKQRDHFPIETLTVLR